jgi:murein DD-endopeptidase MepM/ murein hydrolase activator NlpD
VRLMGWLLALVMLLAFLGDQDERRESSVVCGSTTSSNITATGISWAEHAGQFVGDMLDHGTPESLIKDAVKGMYRVLGMWFSTFFISLEGFKIPPEILQVKENAAQAQADANSACTPCPPPASGGQTDPGPPVDSIAGASLQQPGTQSRAQQDGKAVAVAAAKAAGFTGRDLQIAVAVAGAESGWKASAKSPPNTNGTRDHGMWQINDGAHPDLIRSGNRYDPYDNARMAYKVWQDAGGKWTPWTTYNNGAYRKHLDGKLPKPAPAPKAGPEGGNPESGPDGSLDLPVVCEGPTQDGQADNLIDTRVVWPVPGHATGTYPGHDGVDINGHANDGNNDMGDPIKAAAAGKVTQAGPGKGYGDAIFIQTDTGYRTIYGHTSKILVQVGQHVDTGQLIGEVGSTGHSSAAHLHFGVYPGGTTKAALDFLAGKAPNRNRSAQAATSVGARRVKDPTTGAVFSISIPAGKRGKAIEFAIDQLGKPYVFGAHGPDSWDCSGLTSGAWAAAGVQITPQTEANNREIPHVKRPQPGDLLYKFGGGSAGGHIQMYVGKVNGQTIVIEAPRPGKDVRITRQWMSPESILDPTLMGQPA